MTTTKELGLILKQQRPEYRDLSDVEAGRMLKAARPDLYADVKDVDNLPRSLAVRNAESLQRYFEPEQGIFRSWLRRIQSKSHSETLPFITTAMEQVIRQGAMLEDAALNDARKKAEYQSWLVHQEYEIFVLQQNSYVIEAAAKEGLSPAGLEQKRLLINETDQRYRLAQQENAHQMEMEAYKAQIDYDRIEQAHRHQMEKAEKQLSEDIRWSEERLRLTLIAHHLKDKHQRIILQDLIDKIYKQIAEIKNDPLIDSETKQRMIADRNEMITEFKSVQKNRLL